MTKGDRFNWCLSCYAAVRASIVFLPIAIYGDDINEFPYIFVAAPIIRSSVGHRGGQ